MIQGLLSVWSYFLWTGKQERVVRDWSDMATIKIVERNARIFARDNFHCVYCDYDGSTFERWRYLAIDHFIPRASGGTEDDANLVTACMDCNFMKGSFRFATVAEARVQMGKWVAQERQIFERNFSPMAVVSTEP